MRCPLLLRVSDCVPSTPTSIHGHVVRWAGGLLSLDTSWWRLRPHINSLAEFLGAPFTAYCFPPLPPVFPGNSSVLCSVVCWLIANCVSLRFLNRACNVWRFFDYRQGWPQTTPILRYLVCLGVVVALKLADVYHWHTFSTPRMGLADQSR